MRVLIIESPHRTGIVPNICHRQHLKKSIRTIFSDETEDVQIDIAAKLNGISKVAKQYDIIILNSNYNNGMKDIEIAAKIRQNGIRLPIVLMSHDNQAKESLTKSKLQSVEWFGKPYRLDNLKQLLQNYINEKNNTGLLVQQDFG
jgi:CheY-like chemotaxis protein